MSNIGRLVLKKAGREANRTAVIVDEISDNFVLIDGDVKRRKCNVKHLEFLNKGVKIKKGASTEEVLKALKDIGIEIKPRKEIKEKPKEVKEETKKEKKNDKRKK